MRKNMRQEKLRALGKICVLNKKKVFAAERIIEDKNPTFTTQKINR
jgi:hypothetical protein